MSAAVITVCAILAIIIGVALWIWYDGSGYRNDAQLFKKHPCNDPAWKRAAETCQKFSLR